MSKYVTHVTFLFFLFVAGVGVWMRIYPFHPSRIPYDHLLHAHSHVAFLGWVFLGLILIFLSFIWDDVKNKTSVHMMLISIIAVTLLMFFAFIYQGYDVLSIILSTLHIFVQYWVALFMYLQIKKTKQFSAIAGLYIKGALFALITSSIGPFSLGYIAANGLQETSIFEMIIYFYLHFQYNGWFFLCLIGLFIAIIQSKNISMDDKLVKKSFWLYFLSLFPGYLHAILWANLGTMAYILSAIGVLGQLLAVIGILYAFKGIYASIFQQDGLFIKRCVMVVFSLLLIKHSLELGLLIPGLNEAIYKIRSFVIGYLHLSLLGFVSMFIFVQLIMVHILELNRIALKGAWIFFIGFLLNEVLLFTQGITDLLNLSSIPYLNEGLLTASLLLCIGVIYMWGSLKKEKYHL